jgi:hypothetical protein
VSVGEPFWNPTVCSESLMAVLSLFLVNNSSHAFTRSEFAAIIIVSSIILSFVCSSRCQCCIRISHNEPAHKSNSSRHLVSSAVRNGCNLPGCRIEYSPFSSRIRFTLFLIFFHWILVFLGLPLIPYYGFLFAFCLGSGQSVSIPPPIFA